MKRQTGFTLIELVIVILILGILAAVAAPRFINLEDNARLAAAQGVAAAISSGSTINFAARRASNGAEGVAVTGADNAAVCTAAILGNLVTASTPLGNYTVSAGSTAFADGTFYCTITDTADTTVAVSNFPVIQAL